MSKPVYRHVETDTDDFDNPLELVQLCTTVHPRGDSKKTYRFMVSRRVHYGFRCESCGEQVPIVRFVRIAPYNSIPHRHEGRVQEIYDQFSTDDGVVDFGFCKTCLGVLVMEMHATGLAVFDDDEGKA